MTQVNLLWDETERLAALEEKYAKAAREQLRDRLAEVAMGQILSLIAKQTGGHVKQDKVFPEIATQAYRLADAMLAARGRTEAE